MDKLDCFDFDFKMGVIPVIIGIMYVSAAGCIIKQPRDFRPNGHKKAFHVFL